MKWKLTLVPIESEANLGSMRLCLETNKPKLTKIPNNREVMKAGHPLVHFSWRQRTWRYNQVFFRSLKQILWLLIVSFKQYIKLKRRLSFTVSVTSNPMTYDFLPLPWLPAESGVFHTTGVGDRPGYPATHWTLGLSRESLLGAFLYRVGGRCSCWGWAAHDRDEDD